MKWTKELCQIQSSKYSSRTEWQKSCKGSYVASSKNGWLDEFMESKQSFHSKEDCYKIAQKYSYKSDWERGDKSSYDCACKKGWLEDCASHMTRKPLPLKWTKEECIKDALKYSSKSEWQKNSPSAYSQARSKGWQYIPFPSNLVRPNGYWNLNRCKEEGLKYSSKSEWQKSSRSSYQAASRNGWLNECTVHMATPQAQSSKGERDLLNIIRRLYPKAQKIRFGRSPKGEYGKAFELDIYIPELRKGIEFNGLYWHSRQGLRRGRQKWKENDIEQYHSLKRDFFAKRNIEYLEIQEMDWKNSQDSCVEEILNFLIYKP